jgi:hypothetical protein
MTCPSEPFGGPATRLGISPSYLISAYRASPANPPGRQTLGLNRGGISAATEPQDFKPIRILL